MKIFHLSGIEELDDVVSICVDLKHVWGSLSFLVHMKVVF